MDDVADPPDSRLPSTMTLVLPGGRTVRISRFTFMLVMGALVGASTGAVVVVFRLAAWHGAERLFLAHAGSEHLELLSLSALMRMLMPALGGLLCGALLYGKWRFEAGHSIPTILHAVASGQTYFPRRMIVPPTMAIVTLATGGSAGPEGPVAEIGSVMGSRLGKRAGLTPRYVKTLIGAGVAAGIGAVFNAPIAGMFFALEVILRHYEVASFTPIAVAAVAGSVIAQVALPNQPAVVLPRAVEVSLAELPLFVVLGLLCGLISIAYVRVIGACHDGFQRLRIARWVKPAVGGLMVGLIGWVFPHVMGEGYHWINRVLTMNEPGAEPLWGDAAAAHAWLWGLLLLTALTLLKMLATGLTLGSGSPGGSFAPAVYIGAMSGAAFGLLCYRWGWTADPAVYGAVGMAGLIAGALGAPITAVMIILQQSSAVPQMLLPLLTTVALSMFVLQRSRNVTVYTLGLVRLGIDVDRAPREDPLSLIPVASVMQRRGFAELPASLRVREALERCKDSPARWFVVRGEDGSFRGIVSLYEMRLAIAEQELANLLVVGDLADQYLPRLTPAMTLKQALALFQQTDAEALPVFEGDRGSGAFAGVLGRHETLAAYWRYDETTRGSA